MHITMPTITLVFLVYLNINTLYAQSDSISQCATTMSKQDIELLYSKPVSIFHNPSSIRSSTVYIPLNYIILCDSGKTYCTSLYILLEALAKMDTGYFAPHGIRFTISRESFVWASDSAAWYGDRTAINQILTWAYKPLHLNMVFTGTCMQCGFCACGCAGCCGPGIISIARSCTYHSVDLVNHNKPVIAHEIGHWLGLPHTFTTGSCRECVDRSNCYQCGDGFCDTEADYAVTFQCPYSDSVMVEPSSCPSPIDTMHPDGSLIMGYSYGQLCGKRRFSYEQGIYMHYYIANRHPWLYSIHPPSKPAPTQTVITTVIKDSLSREQVFVSWQSVPNASFYAVSIYPPTTVFPVSVFDTLVNDTFTFARIPSDDSVLVVAVKPLNETNFTTPWSYDTIRLSQCFSARTVVLDTTCDSLTTIMIEVKNGTPPYEFQLDGGLWTNDSLFCNVSYGFHQINVRDANGCLNRLAAYIPPPDTSSSDTTSNTDTDTTVTSVYLSSQSMKPSILKLANRTILLTHASSVSEVVLYLPDGREIARYVNSASPVMTIPTPYSSPIVLTITLSNGEIIRKIIVP